MHELEFAYEYAGEKNSPPFDQSVRDFARSAGCEVGANVPGYLVVFYWDYRIGFLGFQPTSIKPSMRSKYLETHSRRKYKWGP